jgi:hypothetical protein
MRTIPREVHTFQRIKSEFVITDQQKAVLIGTLLGDGSLAKRGKEFRLHIKHAVAQHFFVKYKRDIFSAITSMPIRTFSQQVGQKLYGFSEFVTLTHPTFSYFHSLFYPQGKKYLSTEVCQMISDPLTLAIWFMDDGTSEYASASFNTQCFSLPELHRLQAVLKNRFDIDSSLRKNKRGWLIYIYKRSFQTFCDVVQPFLLPEFSYKLLPYSSRNAENPVETTRQRHEYMFMDEDIVRSA